MSLIDIYPESTGLCEIHWRDTVVLIVACKIPNTSTYARKYLMLNVYCMNPETLPDSESTTTDLCPSFSPLTLYNTSILDKCCESQQSWLRMLKEKL